MATKQRPVIVVYTRFPKALADEISASAQKERRSLAAHVQVLVEEAIRARKNGGKQ